MKRLEILQKLMYNKSYVHEIAVVNLSKNYFLKNPKKTCKPNNHDLNRDWTISRLLKEHFSEQQVLFDVTWLSMNYLPDWLHEDMLILWQ